MNARIGLSSRARRAVALVLLVIVAIALGGCGHTAKRDPVADAGASLSRVQRGTLHVKLDLGAGATDPSQHVGFQMDGAFDLAPQGGSLPAADLTTTNLGAPGEPPAHFVSTARDAYIVQDGVGYQLPPDELASLGRASTSSAVTGLDVKGWAIDPASQPSTTTSAGEAVDRTTGGVDVVVALNGVVDLAGQLGGGTDAALRVPAGDAGRVHSAVRSSSLEVLVGHDDHLLRSVTAHVELATPAASSAGGAVIQALNKLGHVTLTIELRIDHPNAPVTITPPATVRPISELRPG